jgi:selenocysteine lyase/cysteine desulfurase
MALAAIFIEALLNMDHVELIGKRNTIHRTGIISIDFKAVDNGIMAQRLYETYGIATRSGLHCAPSAHHTLKTFPKGTVRFGLSHFLTEDDIHYAVDSIFKLKHIKD